MLKNIRTSLLNLLEKHYSRLSEDCLELDLELDDFYRRVKGLPCRLLGDDPYVGLGYSLTPFEVSVQGFSKRVVREIEDVEGYHTKLPNGNCAAYLDPVGIPTIGFGTIAYEDGKKVRMGDVITRQRAEDLLLWELNRKILPELKKHPNFSQMRQSQIDAIGSFCYNLGSAGINNPKNFQSFYGLLRSPKDWGNRQEVKKVFLLYINAQGIRQTVDKPDPRIAGLIQRRKDEADLWLSDFS